MKQKPAERPASSERIIRDIKRKTRKQYSAEEKIRIVLDGLRGEAGIAELCRREGIAVHGSWRSRLPIGKVTMSRRARSTGFSSPMT